MMKSQKIQEKRNSKKHGEDLLYDNEIDLYGIEDRTDISDIDSDSDTDSEIE